MEKKMLRTIMPEDIIRLARRLLTSCWRKSENSRTNVQASRDSWFSIPSGEEPAPASHPFSWSASLWITGRSPSWSLPFILLPRCPLQLLSPITPSWQRTPHWSTPTVPLWSTMRPSTTSAAGIWALRDHLTPIWTAWSVRLCPQSPPHWDLMEPSTWISLNSRPTWFPTQGDTNYISEYLSSSYLRSGFISRW